VILALNIGIYLVKINGSTTLQKGIKLGAKNANLKGGGKNRLFLKVEGNKSAI